jgi:hypothetical protein
VTRENKTVGELNPWGATDRSSGKAGDAFESVSLRMYIVCIYASYSSQIWCCTLLYLKQSRTCGVGIHVSSVGPWSPADALEDSMHEIVLHVVHKRIGNKSEFVTGRTWKLSKTV